MGGTLTDTMGWQVVVPIKPVLNPTRSHLTATVASRFGGKVVDLDSTVLVSGYDAAHIIDWSAEASGMTDHLVLTIGAPSGVTSVSGCPAATLTLSNT